ncbi:hypothetical protein PGTUg99_019653 [Puccinia graminis f. sp. tritici]|uniref:Tyr recombinase domain-containing protein n=1 Tax=Puccinia graminis f. sp. tritici TaxID=56615 RepID=A0A5B0S0G3_PUCGR|nr:hypothetical protein PGTUg99_019653 [Puccinia graminis f. sp. tritici]
MIQHLVILANELAGGSEADLAILDLALVTFWSLARLGEVTYDPRKGGPHGIFPGDVIISSNGSLATIELKESKTARPGESQFLKVRKMPNLLCPIKALQRRLSTLVPDERLFSFVEFNKRTDLTKYVVRKRLAEVWEGSELHGLSGHLFRVGGASFHNALGVPTARICEIGRWASFSYKLYIREYTAADLSHALNLLAKLDLQWNLSST